MACGRAGRGFVKALNVVDVLDIGLHIPAPGCHIIGVIPFQRSECIKVLLKATSYAFGQQVLKLTHCTSFQRPVGGGNCRPEIPSSRLEAGIWGSLSGAMNPYQGLKEGTVGERLRFGALLRTTDGLPERGPESRVRPSAGPK